MGLIAALPIHGRHHLKVDCDLPPQGIDAIKAYLKQQGVAFAARHWKWDWEITGKGTYVGSLPKRIDKWCHKNLDRNLSKAEKSFIGNLAGKHRHPMQDYYFDFDDQLDWKAGDFGDPQSCIFSWLLAAKRALQNCRWMAMRFYLDENYEKGIGRILIKPEDKFIVVMNGYWLVGARRPGDMALETTFRMATVLGEWLDKPVKKVLLPCHSQTIPVYRDSRISSNYGAGFVVGTTTATKVTLDDQPGVALKQVA